ncbi:hypothetical protein [Halosimplex pelagicum]|uniref:Uncharacterized protein n=1 Tax=Halosimplex pelagicum TaxID=869886 RepID=A0A7D5PAV7_9EURY|nr:hypothetical protein [Halosimplex pelagicum]QLH82045.1 hypothetical protein HZS54_10615 [Halosimplex pelagicum]
MGEGGSMYFYESRTLRKETMIQREMTPVTPDLESVLIIRSFYINRNAIIPVAGKNIKSKLYI